MSKIGDYNIELQQKELEDSHSLFKCDNKAQVLREHIEYLEWEISFCKSELRATVREYNSLVDKEMSKYV